MKKINGKFFILLIFIFSLTSLSKNIGITYKKWGGRLGDQIYYFSKCLMLSHKYNIPLYYKPFEHSDKFVLHTTMPQITPEIKQTFNKKIAIPHESHIANVIKSNDAILIEINYYTKTFEGQYNYWRSKPERFEYIQALLTPLTTRTIQPPKEHISVAVHVRKGGGFDAPLSSEQLYAYTPTWKLIKKHSLNNTPTLFSINYAQIINEENIPQKKPSRYTTAAKASASDKINPKRFPPDQYYIECIKKLSAMVDHQPLYIEIFTDDPNPAALISRYKHHVNLPNCSWNEKQHQTDYKQTIIDDIHALTQFDCLIKGDSYFAWSAQFLGDHRLVFYPHSAMWQNKKLVITKIGILDCTQQLPLHGAL